MLIRLWQILVDAARDLTVHRGRSALTAVTLVIGGLAVTASAAAGEVAQDVFIGAEEQRTARSVTVAATVVPDSIDEVRLARLHDAAGIVLSAQGGRYAVVCESPVARVSAAGGTLVSPADTSAVTLVVGDLPGVRRLPAISGRWLHSDPSQVLPPEVVVNEAAARLIGGTGSVAVYAADGHYASVPLRVVGVIADGADQSMAYVSLTSIRSLVPGTRCGATVLLVHHPDASFRTLSGVLSALATSASIEVSGAPFRMDGVGALAEQLATVRRVLSVMAVIALLLASVGVVNVGFASVGARRRELVIRRAVGAGRFDLFVLVFVHAVALWAVSAALTVVMAVGAVAAVGARLVDPATALDMPAIPWQAMVAGVAAGLAATVAGALAPAFAAARADVARYLRD